MAEKAIVYTVPDEQKIQSIETLKVRKETMEYLLCKYKYKIIYSIGCFLLMFVLLIFTDYLGVTLGNQVPRFAYAKEWSDDSITFKAPFYKVIWHNYDTENEYIEVIR